METTTEAFNGTARFRSVQQRMVFAALVQHGSRTTEELSNMLNIPYTAASARMSELQRMGYIRDSGLRHFTSHGRLARVMEVVD